MKKLINSRWYRAASCLSGQGRLGRQGRKKQDSVQSIIGLIIILSGCCLVPASAQWDQYRFQRSLSDINERWHRIELPNELFQHLRTDYADLRILGTTAAGDTIEAPYLLEVPQDKPQIAQQPFKRLNQSRRGGRFYVTLENRETPTINRIQLDLSNSNFDWRVQLEGSNDQRQWFRILDDYRILALNNRVSNYRFTTLHFPDAQYRYYRLAIPANEKVIINGVSSFQYTEANTTYRSYSIAGQSIEENRKTQRTEIELELPYEVPVSYLSLEVEEDLDYYRPISIEVLSDSTKTENGWTYQYRTVDRDVVSSLEEKIFTFSPTRTRQLRIIIENFDNSPLQLGNLQVRGEVPVIKARFTREADYFLLYGHVEARAPRYDLVQFKDKVPDTPPALLLGEEVRLLEDPAGRGPLFANKAWLWGMMIVVIGLLGWSSLRMLKKA